MKILSIDPSSSCTGYAVFDGRSLIECGTFKPKPSDTANVRIEAMAQDLRDTIAEHAPLVLLIEDTSGKVGRRHKGGGAGLAIYGKSIGYMLATARATPGLRVITVLENEWTRGVSKDTRTARLAGLRGYDAGQDPGGDAADAIGLALWWIARQGVAA